MHNGFAVEGVVADTRTKISRHTGRGINVDQRKQ